MTPPNYPDLAAARSEQTNRRNPRAPLLAALALLAVGNAVQGADTAAARVADRSATDLALPDPFVMRDGRRVASPAMWRDERRPEILELFRAQVYGRDPVGRPADLKFTITATDGHALDDTAVRQDVTLAFSGTGGPGEIHAVLFVPKTARTPPPCFLFISHRAPSPAAAAARDSTNWPARRIVARGYATCVYAPGEVAPDKRDNEREGVFPLFDPPAGRAPDAWGTIAAWAWGASRVMDWLVTVPTIDARRIAVAGLSRGGKTALWCGARDERFALVISNESGSTGAALARGTHPGGETVAIINRKFPHWFCANYKQYDAHPENLPVDQHLLIAAVAPRLVYVSSAEADPNADPENEFLAAVHASPVYQFLGLPGLDAAARPPINTPRHAGRIGYHIRPGPHGADAIDWEYYLDYADRHLRAAAPAAK